MAEDEQSSARTLMSALISKMEAMDNEIMSLKQVMTNPDLLLKQMGLVTVSTPFSEDVLGDGFRPETGGELLKGEFDGSAPSTTEEFHTTSWDDIHEMAGAARDAGLVEEPFKVIAGRDAE